MLGPHALLVKALSRLKKQQAAKTISLLALCLLQSAKESPSKRQQVVRDSLNQYGRPDPRSLDHITYNPVDIFFEGLYYRLCFFGYPQQQLKTRSGLIK